MPKSVHVVELGDPVQPRQQRRRRNEALRWAITGCTVLSLGIAAIASSPVDAQEPATPVVSACGDEVTSWGDASANDVTITLSVLSPDSGTPVASPEAIESQPPGEDSFQIRFSNHGTETATVFVPEITLILCDDSVIAPNSSAFAEPELNIPANEAVVLDVVFTHDPTISARSLVVPVSTESLTAGFVEFPLRLLTSSGTPSSGQDAVGANATGGDGADGEDATGADSAATPTSGT